jgi:hypothetical protein
MKKLFLLLTIFGFISCEAFAQEDFAPNLLRSLVEEDSEKFSTNNVSAFKPNIKNKLVADISLNDDYQDSDNKNEYIDIEARARLYSAFNLSKNISINSFLEFEQADNASSLAKREISPSREGDRYFKNEGLHIEELTIDYDSKNFALVAGKFNPDYGTAWKWNRGIWTHEIADHYRQREKLGLDGVYRLGDIKKTGQYEFGLSVFTNDRKNLDNSTISTRASDSKSDARPGDTRSLKSYVASLDVNFDFGEKFGSKEKLSYHFAYSDLAVNSNAANFNLNEISPTKFVAQKGFVAGLNYEYPVVENFDVDALLEYENTRNLDGNSDITESYFTSSLIGKIYKNWNATFGYAQRENRYVGQNGFNQNLSEISFGYDFNKNSFFDKFTIQAGYKNQRTNYKTKVMTQNVLGILLRYYKYF